MQEQAYQNQQSHVQQQQQIQNIPSMLQEQQSQNTMMQIQSTSSPLEFKIKEFRKNSFHISQLVQLQQCLYSADIIQSHYGIIGIANILSSKQNKIPIQQIIDAGLIPKIIEFAKQEEYIELQAQAVRCLANILFGTKLQIQHVAQKIESKLFVDLLKSKNESLVLDTILAIGNIVKDNAVYRDNLIKYQVIKTLCDFVNSCQNIRIVQQSCWCLSNILRSPPKPKYSQCKNAILTLANMIIKSKITKRSTITLCIQLFIQMIGNDNSRITHFMQIGIFPKLMEFLKYDVCASVSIMILTQFSCGDQHHVQCLIDNKFLQRLDQIFDKSNSKNKIQICIALCNIVYSKKHCKLLFDHHQSLIMKILEQFKKSKNFQIRLQAGYLFSNIAANGNPYQIISIYCTNELMEIYLNMLSYQNKQIIEMALSAINNCLALGQKAKELFQGKLIMSDFMKNKGIVLLSEAQLNPRQKISKKAKKAIETYFHFKDSEQ